VAIGSAPEIGVEFTTWGRMSETSRQAWFDHMRTSWKDGLMSGYAKIGYPDPRRIQEIHQEWDNG
jgi:hypothetical protein